MRGVALMRSGGEISRCLGFCDGVRLFVAILADVMVVRLGVSVMGERI